MIGFFYKIKRRKGLEMKNPSKIHLYKSAVDSTPTLAEGSKSLISGEGEVNYRLPRRSLRSLLAKTACVMLSKAKYLFCNKKNSNSSLRITKRNTYQLFDLSTVRLNEFGAIKSAQYNDSSFHISRFTFHALNAFTLAEVLITLGIIGVVAAMTIPTLMNTINDMHYKSAYRKAYSDLQQAFLAAKDQGLLINTTELGSTGFNDGGNNLNTDQIMQQMKILKTCNNKNNNYCWDSSGERFGKNYDAVNGRPTTTSFSSYIDTSGRAWTALEWSQGRIAVDTNGFAKPNQYGKDRFAFHLYPVDSSNDTTPGIPFRIAPYGDNSSYICTGNICATENNYYGTSWLLN